MVVAAHLMTTAAGVIGSSGHIFTQSLMLTRIASLNHAAVTVYCAENMHAPCLTLRPEQESTEPLGNQLKCHMGTDTDTHPQEYTDHNQFMHIMTADLFQGFFCKTRG